MNSLLEEYLKTLSPDFTFVSTLRVGTLACTIDSTKYH